MTEINGKQNVKAERKAEDGHHLVFPRPAWVEEELGTAMGKGVRVGVIDSGWDHLGSTMQPEKGVSFVDPSDELAVKETVDTHDRIGHGTACMDLISRIAPGAEVVPIRVFGERLETSPETIRAAIHWAVEQDLKLINVSLGTLRQDALRPLYTTCERARNRGVVIVAATHNANAWSYPAVFENVISVGSGSCDTPFDYHYRPGNAVECVAKGTQTVLWLKGKRVLRSGTSFAAPNITGILALFFERFPDATLEDVRYFLSVHAVPNRNRCGS